MLTFDRYIVHPNLQESGHPHGAEHQGGGCGGDAEGEGGGSKTFWLRQTFRGRVGGPGGGGDSFDSLGEKAL